MTDDERGPDRDAVALVLVIGLATAVNLITLASLYDALFHSDPGLSENATQLLTAAIGGMIGLLGSYMGFRAGAAERRNHHDDPNSEPSPVEPDDVKVRIVTIIVLGAALTTSIIGLTLVALFTDRDLFRAEAFTFAGVLLVAALGGVSWWTLRRRRRWHVNVERDDDQ